MTGWDLNPRCAGDISRNPEFFRVSGTSIIRWHIDLTLIWSRGRKLWKKMWCYLRLRPYTAPATTSIPKMITTTGQQNSHSKPVTQDTPTRIIIMPMIRSAIAPPWGSPKHSSSVRLRSVLPVGRVTRLAPHLTHTAASSSFLAPHLVQ